MGRCSAGVVAAALATFVAVACDPSDSSQRQLAPSAIPNESVAPAAESREPQAIVPGHGTVVRIDAASGRLLAVYSTGRLPFILAVAGGNVWTQNFDDASLTVVDPLRGASRTVELGDVAGIAADGPHLWVARDGNTVARLDGVGGGELASFDLGATSLFDPGHPGFLGVGGGSIWLVIPGASGDPERLLRIDPGTGAVLARFAIGGQANPPVADDNYVWVVTKTDHGLTRIDLETDDVVEVPVDPLPWAVIPDGDSVWVSHLRKVVRIDARSLEPVAELFFESNPRGLAAGGGRIWVAAEDGVHAIDPIEERVVMSVALGSYADDTGPIGIAYVDGSVWVSIE
jgi:streptogramin lyase